MFDKFFKNLTYTYDSYFEVFIVVTFVHLLNVHKFNFHFIFEGFNYDLVNYFEFFF